VVSGGAGWCASYARDVVEQSLAHAIKDKTEAAYKRGVNLEKSLRLRAVLSGGFRHLPVVENERIWGIVSRGDFKGMEIDQLDEEDHLWECIR
jgi:CBS domain-containing protein